MAARARSARYSVAIGANLGFEQKLWQDAEKLVEAWMAADATTYTVDWS
jgi:hypothetical protein